MKYNLKHSLTLVINFGFALTALHDDPVCVTFRMSYTYPISALTPTRIIFANVH